MIFQPADSRAGAGSGSGWLEPVPAAGQARRHPRRAWGAWPSHSLRLDHVARGRKQVWEKPHTRAGRTWENMQTSHGLTLAGNWFLSHQRYNGMTLTQTRLFEDLLHIKRNKSFVKILTLATCLHRILVIFSPVLFYRRKMSVLTYESGFMTDSLLGHSLQLAKWCFP